MTNLALNGTEERICCFDKSTFSFPRGQFKIMQRNAKDGGHLSALIPLLQTAKPSDWQLFLSTLFKILKVQVKIALMDLHKGVVWARKKIR
jgi:hypothetical protein